MQKGPGVFFLKIFFGAWLVFSCGRPSQKTGPYAEVRCLPAPGAKIGLTNNDPSPVVLDAANDKLVRELTAQPLVAKTLRLFQRASMNPQEICEQLSGEIENGVLCLRFYHSDKNFSVSFLDGLMKTFEKEKTHEAQFESGKKLELIQQELQEKKTELQAMEDSMMSIKDRYQLPTTNEEMAAFLQQGKLPEIDSGALTRFNIIRSSFEHRVQEYARQMRQHDELSTQHEQNRFFIYIVERPHYVPRARD